MPENSPEFEPTRAQIGRSVESATVAALEDAAKAHVAMIKPRIELEAVMYLDRIKSALPGLVEIALRQEVEKAVGAAVRAELARLKVPIPTKRSKRKAGR